MRDEYEDIEKEAGVQAEMWIDEKNDEIANLRAQIRIANSLILTINSLEVSKAALHVQIVDYIKTYI